jgi:hypothetical protein
VQNSNKNNLIWQQNNQSKVPLLFFILLGLNNIKMQEWVNCFEGWVLKYLFTVVDVYGFSYLFLHFITKTVAWQILAKYIQSNQYFCGRIKIYISTFISLYNLM